MTVQQKKLAFKVSAKAARLIGRENVANAEGAIVELVKNTYDADADHCFIVFNQRFSDLPKTPSAEEYEWLSLHIAEPGSLYEISGNKYALKDDADPAIVAAASELVKSKLDLWIIDNGKGMTADTIEKYWMVIGTNFKEENVFSDGGRVRTGAKGIGRFALDRLGTFCEIRSTVDDGDSSPISLHWQVDWNAFDGSGKVLDDVQATLSAADQTIGETIKAIASFPAVQKHFEGVELLKPWTSGTAICVSGLRDAWTSKDVERLYKTLSALVPPEEQKPLKIYVFDGLNPILYGEVKSAAPTDYDYRLHANVHADGHVEVRITRNELEVTALSPELFARADMQQPRFSRDAFLKKDFSYAKQLDELFPGAKTEEIDALKSIGPFDFTLLFYKRSMAGPDDLRKYPYRSFQAAPRRQWLDEQGGIKIYRDDFLVRPYGEPGGKAYDWLGLGQRVALNPLQASRKGWRASPQNLAGTLKISRASNQTLADQSNREGVIENESFRLFRDLIVRLIKEFEDDRSHILSNLSELDKKRNPTEASKTAGAAAAKRIGQNPNDVKSGDAVTLAAAFTAQQDEIRELKSEQSMLRALATLGTVLVSFSHEMGQLQSTLGGRAKTLEQILQSVIPADALKSLPEAANPMNILRRWDASDQKVRQWFTFALTSVRADKRTRKFITLRDHLREVETTWRPFLSSREVEFSVSFEDNFNPTIKAFEIDLDSVFSNLILNSVEAFISRNYPGKRQIHIAVTSEVDDGILVTYTDSGPGLDPRLDSERKIFNFGETTKTGLNGTAGTGIGMWILDAIVNEHSGSVIAFRPSPEWGFKIEIRLPAGGNK